MNDSESGDQHNESSIAIIGMAGRFPGAGSVDELWRNLRDGVESISFFSDEELLASGIDAVTVADPSYVKAKASLPDTDLFDASFFGFTPRDAEITDPQHRVFLECAWEALENAGYDPDRYSGLIGVYAGVGTNTYLLNIFSNPKVVKSAGTFQVGLANEKDHLTTRVSYKLNLRGPSMNVQTACSTSLVAVHLAYQSLLNGECDIALAGGVAISIPQKSGYVYRDGGILSPDGHCRAFDAKARGTVGGNGAAIVVLKRLADAIEDGDSIHAVILGSAINNDGAVKVGYTSPSVEGQAQVIAEALSVAKVRAEAIGYVEAHGTATELGDPIEIAALTQAFRLHTDRKAFCAIGSIKTNIGHLDAAAGVSGLIKAALAIKHKQIPPSLHFREPNPRIDFANSPFFVNASLSQWRAGATPRRAGVSSFGIGGTNAHVILGEAPDTNASDPQSPFELLTLSARSGPALEAATSNLADFLERNRDANLGDVAYTLKLGRREFGHRRMLVCQSVEDALNALREANGRRTTTRAQGAGDRAVAFMFSGQGAQYVNMASDLYKRVAVFREQVDLCAEILEPHIGLDLRRLLYPEPDQAEESKQRLAQTSLTQPALFVIEYALATLWMKWGVRPAALIGHSIGEYVAACLSGVFSLEDALRIVALRGRLMQQLPRGAMMVVPLSESEIEPLLSESCSIAAVNAPKVCVVSGRQEAVERIERRLASMGVQCTRLHTSHAFHSEMMDPAVNPFREQVKKIKMRPPKIPFVSCLTGTWITETEATGADYWAMHMRERVRFGDAVRQLIRRPHPVLIEVGPGRALSTLAMQQTANSAEQLVLPSLRHPHDGNDDLAFLLNALGNLWLAGVPVAWAEFYAGQRRQRIALPTYPFERKRYWVAPLEIDHRRSETNGEVNAPPFVASEGDWDEPAVERILSQQLLLMALQLETLQYEDSIELPSRHAQRAGQ